MGPERKLKLVQDEDMWTEYQMCARDNSEAAETEAVILFFV